jgi:dTDP-4-dehydrorhamnose reductase
MKVLIVGAQGMLGAQLQKVFIDHELVCCDRDEIDITKVDQVEQKVLEIKPDLIINSAAYNDVDNCESHFEIAQAVNIDGPINLAKAAQKVGAVFVHYSSDYVFEGTKEEGYSEIDHPNPISKYGESKLGGEKVLEYCDKAYVIRTSRLFGAPAKSEGAKKSFVDVMVSLAEKRDTLDVVDEEFSNPTYVNDLAAQTRVLIDGNYDYGIYHGVNEGACTWFEFAKQIFVISGKNVTINPVSSDKFPRPAKRPAYSSLINTKLPKLRHWREALEEYLKP